MGKNAKRGLNLKKKRKNLTVQNWRFGTPKIYSHGEFQV